MNNYWKYGSLVLGIMLIIAGVLYFADQKHVNLKLLESKLTHTMKISSMVINPDVTIPKVYTCDGDDLFIPLVINESPKETKSFALIIDDPDAPNGDFVHFIAWNIDPNNIQIMSDRNLNPEAVGTNGADEHGWISPCPPSGTHHYHFKVYALDMILTLPTTSKKDDLLKAMETHVLDQGELVAKYSRN